MIGITFSMISMGFLPASLRAEIGGFAVPLKIFFQTRSALGTEAPGESLRIAGPRNYVGDQNTKENKATERKAAHNDAEYRSEKRKMQPD